MKKEEVTEKIEKKEKEEVVKEKKSAQSTDEQAVEKVGDMIKNARVKKKIDILKVSEDLRIRRVFLEAIENSNYEAVPEYPYGIGFVRSYAEYLGLSGSRIADLYRTELNINEGNNKTFVHEEIDMGSSVPSIKYIILSLIVLALLYFGWLLFDRYTNDFEDFEVERVSNNVDNLEDFPLQIEDFTTLENPEVIESGGVIEVIDLTNQENANNNQITVQEGVYLVDDDKNTSTDTMVVSKGVEVKILSRIWFEAKDDKRLYVSKIFDEGTSYKVPEREGMIISVGDPSAVEVYIDGKLVENVFTRRKKLNVDLDSFIKKARH